MKDSRGTSNSSPLHRLRARLATTERRLLAGSTLGRLQGHILVLARVAWLAIATVTGALYVASTWIGLGQLDRMCITGLCQQGQIPPVVQRALADLHLSVAVFNGYAIALNILFTAGFATIAAVIFWRRSHDPLALFVSLALLLFGAASFGGELLPLLAAHPNWTLPVELLGFLGTSAFGTFLYVFPDGRFVPRWTLLAAAAWTLLFLPAYLASASPFDFSTWPGVVYFSVWAIFLSTMVVAQVYRYRRVSTPVQRQQTKWVVFGLAAASAGYFAGQIVLVYIARPLTSAPGLLATLAGHTLINASLLLIPICIGIGMLRYHLFDVDLLIRWTLIYSTLVATLAFIYEGGTLVLVKGLLAFTGQESLAIEVAFAFAVGTLAAPLHRRIERSITRVLYRRKYEVERRIDAFSKQVRSELGLETVPERVGDTIAESVEARRRRIRPGHAGAEPQDAQNGRTGQMACDPPDTGERAAQHGATQAPGTPS